MKKAVLIVSLCVLLTGCAGHGQAVYSKSPFSQQEFSGDLAFCNAQAQTATGTAGGFMGLAIFIKNKDLCMAGKGYSCTFQDGAPCE